MSRGAGARRPPALDPAPGADAVSAADHPERGIALTIRALRLSTALALAALAGAGLGCDEDPEQPVLEPLPVVPALDLDGPGHLPVEARGVALDRDDLSVIAPGNDRVGVSPSTLSEQFGLLVLNRPYVDWRATLCPPERDAEATQPRATSEAIIDALEGAGVSFDRIAVNVPLLTPGQRALQYVCFDEGARAPRFDVPEHRREIIEAFRDLAGLPGIEYITVGVEMNRYYHLLVDDERVIDDYSNWITLYREIYAAIKEVDPDIRVGPGVSWAIFHRRTMFELAEELGLGDPMGLEAAVEAYNRTIRPLLGAGRGANRVRTADYLGVTMIPFDGEEPWRGEATADDEARRMELYQAFRWLPLVLGAGTGEALPLVLPQIDWAENSGAAAVKKGQFLEILKTATSGLDVQWAAWRRLSTLPDEPPEANPCRKYVENAEPALRYNPSYCKAGMLSESGERLGVWDVFTAAP